MRQTIKIVIKRSLSLACLWLASGVIADSYDRKDFNYYSYKPNTAIGFYTGKTCDFINIDHVVSLKDAYESGAANWSASKKETFANDRRNHVPSCGRVNSSKGSAAPKDFLRRSRDGKGLDYQIVRWCEYVTKYHSVKLAYQLMTSNNDQKLLASCFKSQSNTG
tara:strand:+ start:99 stop:590 length:492 start_codon:yes stop_codon:yes gene_type:complete